MLLWIHKGALVLPFVSGQGVTCNFMEKYEELLVSCVCLNKNYVDY
jgi:hypothetical protein